MAYRLDPCRPNADEIRRVAVAELDAAVAQLTDPAGPDARAVHDSRKRLKKVRSLVRLARADVGTKVAKRANADLRDAGQALSDRRDADVLVEVADRLLVASDDEATAAALVVLRDELATRAAAAPAPTAEVLSVAAGRIADTSRRLVECRPRTVGWRAIEPGLRDRYGRARRSLTLLGAAPTDEELHEWRKGTKDVWYHLRLLEGVWSPVLEPLVEQAGALADLLGDDHDLAVLTEHLALRPVAALAEGDLQSALVLKLVAVERARLQREARDLGARVLADRASAWTDRLAAWWSKASAAEG